MLRKLLLLIEEIQKVFCKPYLLVELLLVPPVELMFLFLVPGKVRIAGPSQEVSFLSFVELQCSEKRLPLLSVKQLCTLLLIKREIHWLMD